RSNRRNKTARPAKLHRPRAISKQYRSASPKAALATPPAIATQVVAPKTTLEKLEVLPAPAERERTGYDSDTAIKLYLREIGQVKLLTPQEEIELAARIKKVIAARASR